MNPDVPSSPLQLIADATPLLPPEIEYQIFVLAFHSTNDSIGQITLLLVAKRVHEWLIPLFYNVITLDQRNPDPPVPTLQKYGHHVRHFLAKYVGERPLPDMISHCPNISNLALWYGTDPLTCMLDLPVQRLALNSWGFLDEELRNNPNDPRLVEWCSKITHLALGVGLTPSTTASLAHFPRLEYLLILDFYGHNFGSGNLERCTQLKLIIRLLGPVTDNAKTLVAENKTDMKWQDHIPVVWIDGLFDADWKRGAMGLGDLWDLAEREVARRESDNSRARLVKPVHQASLV